MNRAERWSTIHLHDVLVSGWLHSECLLDYVFFYVRQQMTISQPLFISLMADKIVNYALVDSGRSQAGNE